MVSGQLIIHTKARVKVEGHSVQKFTETDRQTDRGDFITSRASVVGKTLTE